MKNIVEKLINDKVLKTSEIIDSFKKIKRHDFLPDGVQNLEDFDAPVPIGFEQTNSQPFTVAFMMELLQPKNGQKILDVGSGSGWTTALLAQIVGDQGKVFGIEVIPELKDFGEKNVAKYNFKNVEMICDDGHQGLPNEAPFDRILVSAAAFRIPQNLKDQLAVGGVMVIPTEAQDIRVLKKISTNDFEEKIHQGFLFVPLIEKE